MKKILSLLLLPLHLSVMGQGSFNVDSLFNWHDPSLPASSGWSNVYNDVWGYAKNGREYAIIGSTMGAHIFDVTQPANSELVAFIQGALTGTEVVHRDYEDHDDYLYMVCDEGASTLQIVDLRQLPDTAIVVYDSDALFSRSHNIAIDNESQRLYVCSGIRPFSVFSLADPTAPTMLLDCGTEVPFWSSIGYVHDVYVRGDTAYLNAGQNGFFVVDFRNINDPQMIGSLDFYPQQGYNHSGWMMDEKPYYAMADETHGMDIKIMDMSDLTNIEVTDTIGSDVHPFSIPHNLIYSGDYLYVSYYYDGVYVYNCTDPEHPTLHGYYDTSTQPHFNNDYRGCWGIYPLLPSGNILASDMQTGLWVLGTETVSGIEESLTSTNTFRVFPNPTNSSLSFDDKFVGSSCRIIDLTGRSILDRRRLETNTIQVDQYPKGMYTLLLFDGANSHSAKFIVE